MGNKNKTLKSRKLWEIVLSVGIMLNTLIVQAEEVVPIQTQIVVEIGEQKKISITKEKNLKWLSGNKEVATVDSNGVVTGIKSGKVYITARDLDTLKDYRCLAVIEESSYEDSGMEGNTDDSTENFPEGSEDEFEIQKELTVKLGEEKQLYVKGEKKNLKWLSGNKEIATVNGDGIVTGIKQGKVWITARDMNTLKDYRCLVTVEKLQQEELFEFSQGL